MEILKKYVSFVKEQAEYNERSAKKYRHDEKRSESFQQRAEIYRGLLADIEATVNSSSEPDRSLSAAVLAASPPQNAIHLSQDDIRDLPEELLRELGLNESDKKDFLVADVIDEIGGVASINKILVAIYNRTGEIEKRTRLVARLYRMSGKGLVYAHPNMKGVYGTKPFAPGEADANQASEEADAAVDDLV